MECGHFIESWVTIAEYNRFPVHCCLHALLCKCCTWVHPRPHSLSTAEVLRHCRNVDGVHTALEKVRHDLEQRHADWWRDVVALAEKIGHGSVTLTLYR